MEGCMLCNLSEQTILYSDVMCRVIVPENSNYPGYLQVISLLHAKELSDLPKPCRSHLFDMALVCEKILREIFMPDKVNVASLGNVVPHVHFHIIARFKHDKHFPNPIWGAVNNPNYVVSNDLLVKKAQLLTTKFIIN